MGQWEKEPSENLHLSHGRQRRIFCEVCWYVYDENRGEPASGFMPGTRFVDLPESYVCPVCGRMYHKSVGKGKFRPLML
ncbi:MAG: rubredoxin [Methanomicrobiales archaeon]|nr:rubredoxin [Methanomicrobiales archaeon]